MPTPSQPDRLCISACGVPLQNTIFNLALHMACHGPGSHSAVLRTRGTGPRVERESHVAAAMSGMAAFVVLDVCRARGEAADQDHRRSDLVGGPSCAAVRVRG
jgi:hypothetical protein